MSQRIKQRVSAIMEGHYKKQSHVVSELGRLNIYEFTKGVKESKFRELIESHPAVESFYIGEMDGAYIFTFKNMEGKEIIATPFFEIQNNTFDSYKHLFGPDYKETDILVSVSDEGDEIHSEGYSPNLKYKFKNYKEYSEWYYSQIDKINEVAINAKLKLSKGATIKNQYEGKTSQQIWDAWTPEQRVLFIADHEPLKEFMKQGNDVSTKKWSELPDDLNGVHIKGVIENHTSSGQYAKGKTVKGDKRRVLMNKYAKVCGYNYAPFNWKKDDYTEKQWGKLIKDARSGKKVSKFAKGATVETADLFEQYDKLPKKLVAIFDKYSDDQTYENCEKMLKEIEPLGYTFEYGLDACPYDLKKIDSGSMATDKAQKGAVISSNIDANTQQITSEEGDITVQRTGNQTYIHQEDQEVILEDEAIDYVIDALNRLRSNPKHIETRAEKGTTIEAREPWQKNLSEDEIGLLVSAMNRYGNQGAHIDTHNWRYTTLEGAKSTLSKMDTNRLTAEGLKVRESLMLKLK